MGDLAFGTVGMEVETAVRERLPIMTVHPEQLGAWAATATTCRPPASASARTGCPGSYAGVAEAWARTPSASSEPDDVVAAIQRGIAATRDGQPAVLEMITKEEPGLPRGHPGDPRGERSTAHRGVANRARGEVDGRVGGALSARILRLR